MEHSRSNYVVLAGGVGAARFLRGLVEVLPPDQITVIINTGDDYRLWGLHISPDIDINLFTLAGIIHPKQGWGLQDDTFNVLQEMKRYSDQTWFQLGDRDLALQLYRTRRLQEGASLTAVSAELARLWELEVKLLPMSNDRVETHIDTPAGLIHFQEYLVKRHAKDAILDIRYVGVEMARPAPGVLDAIRHARAVILPPSNPVVSIGTILAVPGIRQAMLERTSPSVAVSPIVGGRTVKGPADQMLRAAGFDVSPVGVANWYGDLIDGFVIDDVDGPMIPDLVSPKRHVITTDTMMTSKTKAIQLANTVLNLADTCRLAVR